MTSLTEKRAENNRRQQINSLNSDALIHNLTLVTVHELENLNTKLATISGNTPYPFNPNTPSTWTNSRLGIILTQQIDGTQITKIKAQRVEGRYFDGESLIADQLWGTPIDCNLYSSLRVIGIATGTFYIYGSIDNVTYYNIDEIIPDTNPKHLNHFNYLLQNPPRYITIKNSSSPITITLDYSVMS